MSRQNHSPPRANEWPSGPHQVTRSAVTSRLAVHTNSRDSVSAVYSCRVPRNTHKCLWFLGVSVSLLSPISGNSRCTSSREDMYRTKPKRLMGQLSPSQASFLRIQFLGTLLVNPRILQMAIPQANTSFLAKGRQGSHTGSGPNAV